MNKSEFLKFFDELKKAYPYDFKGANNELAEWWAVLKDCSTRSCLNAIKTFKSWSKLPPTADKIFESATKYNGMPDLIYSTMREEEQNMKRVRNKKKAVCRVCGKPLPERRTSFCSAECKKAYYRIQCLLKQGEYVEEFEAYISKREQDLSDMLSEIYDKDRKKEYLKREKGQL